MIIPALEGRTLCKAHGTGNDFILVPDFDGTCELTASDVAQICDRHRGIGADGLIRVVRTEASEEFAHLQGEATWAMDYRNADGSLAQMCGNGVRVFAHYLRIQGIAHFTEATPLAVATRGGVKYVTYAGGLYTVDMGPYELGGTRSLTLGGNEYVGQDVSMPNPHTVVRLDEATPLESIDFSTLSFTDVPEEGTNLEVITRAENPQMRVLERGVGETLACGTGTCAAALVHLLSQGSKEGTVQITSPGGELIVRIEGGHAYLTGPAFLVAELSLIGLAGYANPQG